MPTDNNAFTIKLSSEAKHAKSKAQNVSMFFDIGGIKLAKGQRQK